MMKQWNMLRRKLSILRIMEIKGIQMNNCLSGLLLENPIVLFDIRDIKSKYADARFLVSTNESVNVIPTIYILTHDVKEVTKYVQELERVSGENNRYRVPNCLLVPCHSVPSTYLEITSEDIESAVEQYNHSVLKECTCTQ